MVTALSIMQTSQNSKLTSPGFRHADELVPTVLTRCSKKKTHPRASPLGRSCIRGERGCMGGPVHSICRCGKKITCDKQAGILHQQVYGNKTAELAKALLYVTVWPQLAIAVLSTGREANCCLEYMTASWLAGGHQP